MRLYVWARRDPGPGGYVFTSKDSTRAAAIASRKTERSFGYALGPIVVVDLPEPGRKKGKK